jgi:hypothetical protein
MNWLVWFGFMVFNATFNNISVITWQSILLVEETSVPRENHQPVARHWQTLSMITRNNILHVSIVKFRGYYKKRQWKPQDIQEKRIQWHRKRWAQETKKLKTCVLTTLVVLTNFNTTKVVSTHVFSFFVSCAQRFLCHWILFSWMSCGFHWRFL